jgi:hypothetical protein
VLIVKRISRAGLVDPRFPIAMLALCLIIWVYQFCYESRAKRVLEWAPVKVGAMTYMLFHLLFFSGGATQPFVYLQF